MGARKKRARPSSADVVDDEGFGLSPPPARSPRRSQQPPASAKPKPITTKTTLTTHNGGGGGQQQQQQAVATFSKGVRRAALAAADLARTEPVPFDLLDASELRRAFEQLAGKEPRMKWDALALRGLKELSKLKWAFPDRDELALATRLVAAGFSHRAASVDLVVAELDDAEAQQLGEGDEEDEENDDESRMRKRIAKALRAAVEQRKADASVDVMLACLDALRETLRSGDAS